MTTHTPWLEEPPIQGEPAPDMLEALRRLVACCEQLRAFKNPKNQITRDRLEAARAAIAKAEGRGE